MFSLLYLMVCFIFLGCS